MRATRCFPAWLAFWLCVFSACTAPGATDAKADPVSPAPAAKVPSAAALQAKGLPGVLEAYEMVRGALAADDMGTALERAKVFGQVVSGVSVQTAEAQQVAAIGTAVEKLLAQDKAKPDAVRKAFGEVSKAVVALLSGHPALSQGLHLFECPMAQGYKRWVQPASKLANPYMGTRMLECGTERQF